MAITAQSLPHGSRPPRVEKRRNAYLSEPRRLDPERGRLVTLSYQETELENIFIRRAQAFKKFLAEKTIVIHEDELIVGGKSKYLRGCQTFPDWSTAWLKQEMAQFEIRIDNPVKSSAEERRQVLDDIKYWEGKSAQDQIWQVWRRKFGEVALDSLTARLLLDHAFESHGRVIPDYEKLVHVGLKGVIQAIDAELEELKSDTSIEVIDQEYFLEAAKISCEAVINFAHRHADLARQMAANEKSPTRKQELETIAEICDWVPEHPPRTFYEGLQGWWFAHLAIHMENDPHGLSPGRFDQFMYPLYKKDLEAGRLTRDHAKELLECLWVKMSEVERLFPNSHAKAYHSRYQNMCIGGTNSDGSDSTNELSYLILDVTEEARMIQPTLSLRYHDGAPQEFLKRAAEVVRTGIGMPAFFNGKAIVPLLMERGVPKEEALDWAVAGCVEMYVAKNAPNQVTAGFVNLAKCLEFALNNGVDPVTKLKVGLETGDPRQFKTFADLWEAFVQQAQFAIKLISEMCNVKISLNAKLTPLLFQSCLIGDCIKNGKDTNAGGARYNNLISNVIMAMVDVGNSLVALKKLVYEEQKLTLDQALNALEADFVGYEDIQHLLRQAPKYGNDDDYADEMVRDIFTFTENEVTKQNNHLGYPYVMASLSIVAHYHFGDGTGALPNGRKAFTPLTDGTVSPSPDTDKKGPTAVINSAAKSTRVIGIKTISTLLNQKFHPSALDSDAALEKMLALIKTYFDNYGNHMQFNVVSRDTLVAAQAAPEEYRDLIVRVAGFSTFFVDLPKAVQDEIIARTEQIL